MSLSRSISQKSTPILIPTGYDVYDERADDQLKDRHIDLWEHAALLYHAYEWQAAADAFASLSKTIENSKHSAVCLLNAGMIQARLGGYVTAAPTLEEAARIDQSYLVTLYILGIISYELQDYSRADFCFEVCLDGLIHGAIDYKDVGLDFVLDRAMLQNNLRAVRSAQYSSSFPNCTLGLVPLDAIPAECIFEAPPRSNTDQDIEELEQDRPNGFRRLFGGKRPASVRSIFSIKMDSRSSAPESLYGQLELRPPTSSPSSGYRDSLLSIPEDTPAPFAGTSQATQPLRSQPPVERGNHHRSWRGRPTTPFTPRDARVGLDSTRDLAKFIRQAEQGQVLIPRDAKGEYESLKELSRFVELYAPDMSPKASVQPLGLDPHRIAELRSARLLSEDDDKNAVLSPTSGSSLPEIPIPRRELQYSAVNVTHSQRESDQEQSVPSLYTDSGTHSSFRWSDEGPLELLQPTVYQGATRKRPEPTYLDQISHSPKILNSEPSTPPTSPSASSISMLKGMAEPARKDFARNITLKTLEGEIAPGTSPLSNHREDIARELALKALEGKVVPGTFPPATLKAPLKVSRHDKPLPPDPGGGHSKSSWRFGTPNTVATEHFFDRILGPGKRSG